jgi:TonB family protein
MRPRADRPANEQGTVEGIKVTDSSATDVNFIPNFNAAAVAALEKWRYPPATLHGKPVPFYFTVTLTFMMSH